MNIAIPERKISRIKLPKQFKFTHVTNPSLAETGFVNVASLINPKFWKNYRGFASDKLDKVTFN